MELQGLKNMLNPVPLAGQRQGPPSRTEASARTPASAAEHEALVKAARQFESVFLNQLMQAMRKTVPDNKLFNSNGPMKYYQQMQDSEMAKAMAAGNGGFGIAELIVQQLSLPASAPESSNEPGSTRAPLMGPPSPQTMKSGVERYRHVSCMDEVGSPAIRLRALAARQGPAVADTLNRFEPEIKSAADASGLPQELLLAVVMEESGGDPRVQSPKGAQGLMQLMPATAADMGVTDRAHPGQNLQGGAKYLARMLDRYEGQLPLALAAYNAGPGQVDRAGGKVPDFPETKNYVERVLRRYDRLGGGTDLASSRAKALKPGTSPE